MSAAKMAKRIREPLYELMAGRARASHVASTNNTLMRIGALDAVAKQTREVAMAGSFGTADSGLASAACCQAGGIFQLV